VAPKVIAIEGGEGKLARTRLDDVLWARYRQEFQIAAVELDDAVSGTEGVLTGGGNGKAELSIELADFIKSTSSENEMIDTFQ
jgi:hypothetical protein